MKTKNEYDLQAEKFLSDTQTELSAEWVEHGRHFEDDKATRDIYEITLKRGGRSFTFRFGQAIADTGKRPTAYDVLACLTKCDPGSFEEFCSSYGYQNDRRRQSRKNCAGFTNRKAEKIYKAVLNEWQNIQILWPDEELELFQEIQ